MDISPVRSWVVPRSLSGWVDAHMPHPGSSSGVWPSVRLLMSMLEGVNERDMQFLDKYKADFGEGE